MYSAFPPGYPTAPAPGPQETVVSQSKSELPITRRTALALGGGTAAGLLLPGGFAQAAGKSGPPRQSGKLPSLEALERSSMPKVR
jgi:hypothetical protein